MPHSKLEEVRFVIVDLVRRGKAIWVDFRVIEGLYGALSQAYVRLCRLWREYLSVFKHPHVDSLTGAGAYHIRVLTVILEDLDRADLRSVLATIENHCSRVFSRKIEKVKLDSTPLNENDFGAARAERSPFALAW